MTKTRLYSTQTRKNRVEFMSCQNFASPNCAMLLDFIISNFSYAGYHRELGIVDLSQFYWSMHQIGWLC